MATGYLDPFLEQFYSADQGSFVLAPLPQDERGLYDVDSLSFGSLLRGDSEPQVQFYGGAREFSFVDDFYFRIYLIPQVLDFGAIVATTTRDVLVWNAYFTPVTLESIEPTIGDEVTQTGDALPFALDALSTHTWQFSVGTQGPPTLDEAFVFTFDTGELFTLPVTGTRSILWPFLPNWNSPFRMTLEYDTSIFTGRSGREQRIAERAEPRANVEFDIAIGGEDRRRFRELMAQWQDKPFVVADMSRNVLTEDPMLAGATSVVVEETPSWLFQEDRAVVLVNEKRIGLRVVDNLDDSGNLLTFKDTDEINWPAGTKIYAGVVANLEDERSTTRHTTNALSGTMRFNVLPGTELVEVPPLAPLEFNDRELFMFKPNWGEPVEGLDRRITEYVDYGVGRIARFSPLSHATQVWTQTFLGRDAENIRELLDVFKRAKGRQGEFYAPTWEEDVPLKGDLVLNSLSLRAHGLNIFNAFATDPTTRAVMVELNDGTRYFRAIEEITEIDDIDGHDTLINVTQVWPTTIANEDVRLVCWLRCWRFATDDLTAEFLTNSVANLTANFQTLEDLPAENNESSNSP